MNAPARLAIHDPATLAWSARMVQVWLERRRARIAAENLSSPAPLPERGHSITVSGHVAANHRQVIHEVNPQ